MDSPAFDTLNQDFFVYFEFKNLVNIHLTSLKHAIKFLSLSNSARETIKKNTTFTLRVAEIVVNQIDNEFIGDKLATLHDGIGLLAELSASFHSITKHVTSRQVANAKIVSDLGALCTFTRSWRSNHDDILGWAFSALIAALDLSEKVIKFEIAKIHSECAGFT